MANSPRKGDQHLVPDSSWQPLFRAGALAAGLAVILYVAALAMFVVTPAPPLSTSGGAATLEYVAGERAIYIIRQLLWLAPSLLMVVVALAVAISLYPVGKSFAAIAGVIAVTSWAVSFGWPTTGGGVARHGGAE